MLPEGIVSSGFPRVRETCRQIGVEFDPWQTDLNKCILAKASDGLYAADTVVLSVGRQVGKTFDIGALAFAECIAEPGTTVVWTAHRFKVARETFNELRALAKSPKLAPHIDYDAITTAAGNECIPFLNGSRIVFAARERGAVRGFSKVRILILDEAQILTDSVLADLAPTMNQAVNPLIILMGTPPKPTDPSEVFTSLRLAALEQFEEHGHSIDGVLYVEFSAEPNADSDDRTQWKVANPSYPTRTPARAILRLRKLLSDDDFLREALGVWDDDGRKLIIPLGVWAALGDSSPNRAPHVGKVVLAVDSDPDRVRTSIVAAGARAEGPPMVEITSDLDGLVDSRPGVDWAEARLIEICSRVDVAAVVVDEMSAAASLIPALIDAKVPVVTTNSRKLAQACGLFFDAAVETGEIAHLDDPLLVTALKGATKRALGDAWAWDRKKPTSDITPLVAATLAYWGHVTGVGVAKNAGKGRVIALG